MSHYLLKLKPFAFVTVGVLSTLGALSLTHLGPAQAQSPGVNLTALLTRLTTDEQTITAQNTTIANLQGVVGGVQSKQSTDETNISGLQTLTAPLSLSSDPYADGTNTLLTISGVNVQIVNGLGTAAATMGTINGLGNLTIGYNLTGNGSGNTRTGSHNLIVGDYNSYSSFGGLIAGNSNSISGPYASVSGGYQNMASADYSSVSGGGGNTASRYTSSVSGGHNNTASGKYSSVSGGLGNKAAGVESTVSGGVFNATNNYDSSVSGGQSNVADGISSTVSGGTKITQYARYGWSGGKYYSP